MTDMSECIAKGLDHHFQFERAENGQSVFRCVCGATVTELEDSQP